MKIALVQISPVWENPKATILKIDSLIKSCETADVIIFPEMTLTGFSMDAKKLSEDIDGVSTTYFINLSREIKKHIVAGIIEREGEKVYNTAVHFNRDGLISARYRKVHRFSMANEDKYYNSSRQIVITKIDDMSFGLSVCYDLRFPELYRLYAKERVDGLINIANWPVQRIRHWNKLLAARAIENLSFMIGCNRTGNDPYYEYNGHSAVYSPMGEEMIIMDNSEKVSIVEINSGIVNETREKLNFLDDITLI
jgi:predicted amidohydrolase